MQRGIQCMDNKSVEFTSPTATPAVLLWLCRGLCFPVCLPSWLYALLKQKGAIFYCSHFSLFLSLWLWLHTVLQSSLSLSRSVFSDVCIFSLSLVNKAEFLQFPPAVSRLLFFPSITNIHFFIGCWQWEYKLSLLHPAVIIPTATNEHAHCVFSGHLRHSGHLQRHFTDQYIYLSCDGFLIASL